MKILTAKAANSGFGWLIGLARAEPGGSPGKTAQ
jgi:hypothetical protein